MPFTFLSPPPPPQYSLKVTPSSLCKKIKAPSTVFLWYYFNKQERTGKWIWNWALKKKIDMFLFLMGGRWRILNIGLYNKNYTTKICIHHAFRPYFRTQIYLIPWIWVIVQAPTQASIFIHFSRQHHDAREFLKEFSFCVFAHLSDCGMGWTW